MKPKTGKIEKEAFNELVYEVVRLVPYGRVTNYGAVAKAIGFPNLSRMVGAAMGGCGMSGDAVPAHRVVNSSGRLTGKAAFGGPEKMQRLLEAEGVVVKNDKVCDFRTLFWDPINEIGN